MAWRNLLIHAVATAGVLAGTACRETEAPFTVVTEADTADHVMFGLRHMLTENGVLQARLLADVAHLYEQSQLYGLKGVTVEFFSTTGEHTSTLTSDSGLYYIETGTMEGIGNVVGTTPDGRRLETERVEYVPARREIIGSEPFVFDSPDQHLVGSSFVADPDFTNVQSTNTSGRVGRIQPTGNQ